MAKSSKLIAVKRGRVLLVRRRRDRLWMFPGGRRRGRETEKDCLRREIREELPELKLGRLRLWKEVKAKNRRSGRKMSGAIFVAKKASGRLAIGDKKEIDRATWRKPRGIRLTPTSRCHRENSFAINGGVLGLLQHYRRKATFSIETTDWPAFPCIPSVWQKTPDNDR